MLNNKADTADILPVADPIIGAPILHTVLISTGWHTSGAQYYYPCLISLKNSLESKLYHLGRYSCKLLRLNRPSLELFTPLFSGKILLVQDLYFSTSPFAPSSELPELTF